MVEQGLEFAAARIQGLARGKHARRVVSSIWRQAEEYARDIVRGEREARMKKEKEERAKAKVKRGTPSRTGALANGLFSLWTCVLCVLAV